MSDISTENQNKRKGLGRGLGSLLSAQPTAEKSPAKNSNNTSEVAQNPVVPATTQVVSMSSQHLYQSQVSNPQKTTETNQESNNIPADVENKIWKIAIDKLSSGQFQPRKTFEKEALQELAQSIKENGILQPIVARRLLNNKFEIIAGERRWRASQMAGLHEVPVILRNFNDKEALELAIVENIQREDLNAIEEAEGYSRLILEFKLSQQQVAEKVGRDRATVANAVRLLSLPAPVKDMISKNELSVGHAKVLLSLADPKQQLDLARKIQKEKIAVRKLEKIVQSLLKGEKMVDVVPAPNTAVKMRLIEGLSNELQKLMGTKVSIDYSDSKGKISIYYYSDEELNNLADRLKEGWQT